MSRNFRREKLIDTLKKQKDTKNLILVDMLITDEGCATVTKFLKKNPHFEEVDLKSNKITPTGFLKLCNAFKHMKKLKVLSLNSNYLGEDPRAMEGLYTLLVNANSTIQVLNLKNNEIKVDSIKPIADFIKDSVSL